MQEDKYFENKKRDINKIFHDKRIDQYYRKLKEDVDLFDTFNTKGKKLHHVIICDLDGTLSLINNRSIYDEQKIYR